MPWNPRPVVATVYVRPDATPEEVSNAGAILGEMPQISEVRFIDRAESLERGLEAFGQHPEISASLTLENVPTFFRCTTRDAFAAVEVVNALKNGVPGIFTENIAIRRSI